MSVRGTQRFVRVGGAGMAAFILVFLAGVLSGIPVINFICIPFLLAGILFARLFQETDIYVEHWNAIHAASLLIDVALTWAVLFALMKRSTRNAAQKREQS